MPEHEADIGGRHHNSAYAVQATYVARKTNALIYKQLLTFDVTGTGIALTS